MEKEPPTPLDEILTWCKANRPDLVSQLPQLAKDPGLMLIMSVAFASGCAFERSPVNAGTYLPQNKDPYEASKQ